MEIERIFNDMKKTISFTTIPSRINRIKPMLDSLLNQTIKPDEIILWVGHNYKRLTETDIKIPEFILKSGIRVELVEDMGPFTKLFYTLKEQWNEKESIIVTVDDDVYYPTVWFENLINMSMSNTNSAIGYRGRILLGDKSKYNLSKLYLGSDGEIPVEVDIITGTWGALYKPNFFTEDIFNTEIINNNFFVDDLWITNNLIKNNISRIVIKNVGVEPLSEISNIDSLWSINNNSDNNDKMLKYFKYGK